MKKWLDKKIVGAVFIGLAIFCEVWVISQAESWSAWGPYVALAITVVPVLASQNFLAPGVSWDEEILTVRNVMGSFSIPWVMVEDISSSGDSRLIVSLTDSRDVTVVAFSNWPVFGRHERIIRELEAARRNARSSESSADGLAVAETPSSGLLEFFSAVTAGGLLLTALVMVIKDVIR